MKARVRVMFSYILPVLAWAQAPTRVPQFEDYPVREFSRVAPAAPNLVTPEERRFRTVIRQGVEGGYGVSEGPTGRKRAGRTLRHYFLITWGCGSPCLMAAIVDAKSGCVFPPPSIT